MTIGFDPIVSGIVCPKCFLVWMRINGSDRTMQPGRYQVEPFSTYLSLGRKVVSGNGQAGFLVIPEGATTAAVKKNLKDNNLVINYNNNLDITPLPMTLRFAPRAEYKNIVARINALHDKFISELAQTCPKKFQDKFERVASIIQKESSYKKEYPFIAAVIYNRINANMRLQIDVYQKSYKTRGLPQKPISAPSKDALMAACYPEQVEWLYYVAMNGRHVFSSNYQNHLQVVNRRKYVH